MQFILFANTHRKYFKFKIYKEVYEHFSWEKQKIFTLKYFKISFLIFGSALVVE